MIRRIALIAAIALAACREAPPTAPGTAAPVASVTAVSDVIPGQFIVTLRAGEDPTAVAAAHGVAPRYLYRRAIVGFAGSISDAARAGLLRDARVVRVEQDQVMHAWTTTQSNATWGLDRVDQRALPLSGTYTYDYDGTGVTAYIIDTGILVSHNDFGGRASVGVDVLNDGHAGIDCAGHGTHVSGTVGGATYGIAKNVELVAVRVLNCSGSGTTSGVIAGVDWVTANHLSPAVANMSLGGGASTTLDNAVASSISSGVAYAVAAGNGDWLGRAQNACNYSPARVASAMTIGATDATDTKASWSNYGSCVDWFAPGVSITSDWYTSNTATNTISGTSMATPHTAGVAALVLQAHPSLTAQAVRDTIFAHLTTGIVKSSNTTNNHLLYSLTPPPAGNVAPTAAFTYSCGELSCNFTDASTDSDGTIVSWSWNFGDAATSTAKSPSHTYAAGGTYTVTETVTDDDGATGAVTHSVTVRSSSASTPANLTATKVTKGATTKVNLKWTGGAATVDVLRNGGAIASGIPNTHAYSDNLGKKPTGTFTYLVCNAGTQTCSNTATVTF